MTVPQPFLFLDYHARRRPDAIALSTIDRDFTYAETLAYATSIAALLRRRGVQPGDVVCAQLREGLNLLFMEAVFHEAAIWCTYAEAMTSERAEQFDWLLTHQSTASFPPTRTILVDESFMEEVTRAEHSDAPRHYDSFSSVCRISYSSGTTGSPVAIAGTVERQGRSAVGWLENRPFFSLIQGFSGSGVKTASVSIYHGDTYICPGTAEENVTLAQRNYVSTLQGSPVQLAEFLATLSRRDDRRTDISTVQYIGSFLPESLLTRLREELNASVTACYGSSEVGMVAIRHDVTENPADVGPPLPHVTIEIVDDSDEPVATGTEGHVRVRTTRRTVEYFRPSGATPASLRDGWFYPGDLGRLSDEGHLVLTGRASEVINAGGVKFHPELLDGLLRTHPGVLDGAIIAMPDAENLSGYAAVIVVEDEFALQELVEPLRAACGGVPPVSIVRVTSIARDHNGKVRRAEVADDVRRRLA